MKPLLLASGSPRRQAILRAMGVPFEVSPPDCEECVRPGDPVATVGVNACRKALAARARHPDALILAADTVVSFGGRVLGKPRSPEEARAWLLSYAGKSQQVFTAVAFLLPGHSEPERFIEATSLVFCAYGPDTAEDYLRRVRPFDRAGAYDIDACGDLLIAERIGSYTNVMGLPRGVVAGWLALRGLLPSRSPRP